MYFWWSSRSICFCWNYKKIATEVTANESRGVMQKYSCAIFRQNRCYFWRRRCKYAFSPKMPWTAIIIHGDLQILVPASPEEEKEGCHHSKIWKSAWAPLNWKISPLYQWFYSVFSITLICCLYKQTKKTTTPFCCILVLVNAQTQTLIVKTWHGAWIFLVC